MKGDERSALVLPWELRPRVEEQGVRRPVGWKPDSRWCERAAAIGLLPVAAVFGIGHQLLFDGAVEAVRPTGIRSFCRLHQVLGRPFGILLRGELPRPQRV